MKNIRPWAIAAIVAITLFACKKSDSGGSSTSLIVRNWKQTDITLTVNNVTQSIFSQQTVCDVDNIYTFLVDGKLAVTEGATKCNPADADTVVSGNWSLLENDKKLSITDGSGTQFFVVESLSASDLVLSDTATVSGLLTKGTLYFKAQ